MIKVWRSEKKVQEVAVEFPVYTRWISSDTADTFNRLGANGSCISITKRIGEYDENYDGPAFEIKRFNVDLSGTVDGSYIPDGHVVEASAQAEFLIVFDEMIVAITKMRAAI